MSLWTSLNIPDSDTVLTNSVRSFMVRSLSTVPWVYPLFQCCILVSICLYYRYIHAAHIAANIWQVTLILMELSAQKISCRHSLVYAPGWQWRSQGVFSGGWNLKPEGLKFEAEGRERGWGSWGGGSEPPPHQLGGLGSAVSSPSGVRGIWIYCILGLENRIKAV